MLHLEAVKYIEAELSITIIYWWAMIAHVLLINSSATYKAQQERGVFTTWAETPI